MKSLLMLVLLLALIYGVSRLVTPTGASEDAVAAATRPVQVGQPEGRLMRTPGARPAEEIAEEAEGGVIHRRPRSPTSRSDNAP